MGFYDGELPFPSVVPRLNEAFLNMSVLSFADNG